MTTAELVNLIAERFRTGRVTFLNVNGRVIDFEYGFLHYRLTCLNRSIQVCRVINYYHTATDSYSQWVEGVLSSKSRDEDGVLV